MPAPAQNVQAEEAPIQVEDFARLAEIQVMLALLADPATFPCPIRVRASAVILELSGTVPSEEVRFRALELAGENCTLSVMDALRSMPSRMPSTPSESPDRLVHVARELLAKGPGKVTFNLDVRADASGRIRLTGTIPSYEEKLAISHGLRRLHGCTSVDNQLDVWRIMRDGKAYSLVTPDGRYMVPIDTTAENATRPPANRDRAPNVAEPAPTVASSLGERFRNWLHRGATPKEISAAPGEFVSAPTPERRHAGVNAMAAASIVTSPYKTTSAAPAVSRPEENRPVSTLQLVSSPPAAVNPALAIVQPYSNSIPANAVNSIPANAVNSIPANAASPRTYESGIVPAIYFEKLASSRNDAVGMGVLVLASAKEPPESLPRAASDHLQSWLRLRIEKTCAGDVQNVTVVLRSNTALDVTLKVRDERRVQTVADKIMRMQELKPYQATLKFQVK